MVRVMLRWLLALAIGLALALPVAAREEIRAFAADVVLSPDGAVAVRETIDVQAEGHEIRRGIYRDIPVTLLGPDGGKIRPGFAVTAVTRDGQVEPFRVERMGEFQRIWIGDPDRLLRPGQHRYVLDYTMTRMARSFADHDELFWNATGNYWIFPIAASVATVTLPQGAVVSDLVGYTGAPGSTEQAVSVTRTSDNRAIFRTTRALGPGEGMSFAVAFKKGVLVLPTGLDAWLQWVSDLREVIFPVLAALLVLAYNFLAWNAVGRDPAKGVIIPLFYPPKGFSPGLTHYVHKWGFDKSGWTAFTATIFELGVKGLVRVDNSGEALRVAVTGKQPESALPTAERLVFNYFDARGDVTVDKASGPDLQKKRGEFVAAIENENRATWFRNNTAYSVLGAMLAVLLLVSLVALDVLEPFWLFGAVAGGVVLALLSTAFGSLWKGSMTSRFVTVVWLVIVLANVGGFAMESLTQLSIDTAVVAAVSIVLITVIFAVLMRAPTVQGRKVMDQIDGFRMYLETAEKERLNMSAAPAMTVERFERILPYAVALGVEKPWSEHFEAELARNAVSDVPAQGYAPLWYSGRDYGAGNMASNMSNAVSAAAASMTAAMVAAQPVQASSSGFSGGGGGGSSGGGGGGGGGGGW